LNQCSVSLKTWYLCLIWKKIENVNHGRRYSPKWSNEQRWLTNLKRERLQKKSFFLIKSINNIIKTVLLLFAVWASENHYQHFTWINLKKVSISDTVTQPVSSGQPLLAKKIVKKIIFNIWYMAFVPLQAHFLVNFKLWIGFFLVKPKMCSQVQGQLFTRFCSIFTKALKKMISEEGCQQHCF
jgi:hypothetical protein